MKKLQKQFFNKRNEYITKKDGIEHLLEQKNSKKDEKKLLLELLGYYQSIYTLLTNGKELGFLTDETANFYIANVVRHKQAIFYKLTK